MPIMIPATKGPKFEFERGEVEIIIQDWLSREYPEHLTFDSNVYSYVRCDEFGGFDKYVICISERCPTCGKLRTDI